MKLTRVLFLTILLAAAAPSPALDDSGKSMADAARINVRLGVEYMKQGQLAIAKDKIDKALQQNPKDPGVQLGAGLLYEQLKQPKKAEQHYRQVLRLDPGNPEGQNALGAFLCRNEQAAKGEAAFLEAAENPVYRTPEVAYTNAAVCARRAGRLEQAEQYLRRALAKPAIYPEALLQMAGISFERSNSLQARAFLQRYLDVRPETPDVLLLGYQVESALDDRAAASDYLDRLRTKFPQSPEARIVEELSREGAE